MTPSVTRRNFKQYDLSPNLPGMLAYTSQAGISTQLMGGSTARVSRFVPSRNLTIVSMACCVSTVASAADAICMGIFSSDMATLHATTGAVTSLLKTTDGSSTDLTATGGKYVALSASFTVLAGVTYYAGLSYGTLGGANAATFVAVTYSSAGAARLFGNTAGLTEADLITAGTPHPLAAGATLSNTAAACPLMALRTA